MFGLDSGQGVHLLLLLCIGSFFCALNNLASPRTHFDTANAYNTAWEEMTINPDRDARTTCCSGEWPFAAWQGLLEKLHDDHASSFPQRGD